MPLHGIRTAGAVYISIALSPCNEALRTRNPVEDVSVSCDDQNESKVTWRYMERGRRRFSLFGVQGCSKRWACKHERSREYQRLQGYHGVPKTVGRLRRLNSFAGVGYARSTSERVSRKIPHAQT